MLSERVEGEFLPFVRRPGRYIGGEVNQVKKDWRQCEVKAALCFPDVYEIGMSHRGLGIIYDCLNKMEGVAAERVFAPWEDAEKVMREKGIPLFSLESKAALSSFDIVGFSLTNELCYTNVLNMLDLGGIAVRSAERGEDGPLIVAGGGMSNCCEPMADFVDLFLLGEGEEAAVEFVELVREMKRAGAANATATLRSRLRSTSTQHESLRSTRKEILAEAAKRFEWAYAPSLYEFEYEGGRIRSFKGKRDGLRLEFADAVVEDFENASVPERPIVPFVQAVHERVSVEIMRGCPGRCRFCQASFCRRPIRYRSIAKIIEIAKANYHATGLDTVGLLSLSSADYPNLDELVAGLSEYFAERHVGVSMPSLRVDEQLKLLPKLVRGVRKGGITIAVEAASERLRRIINKPLKDEDLFAAVEAAYRAGWQRLKLYFMVGLPGETEEDIGRIAQLSYDLAILGKKVAGRAGQINAAVSWFVPKAHTPFGWLGQRPMGYFERAKGLILDEKRRLRGKFVQFKFHDIQGSVLESAIGRGDRRCGDVIEAAWRSGARFDLWDECFDYGLWKEAFAKFGMNVEAAAQRQFEREEILPWQHLGGPEKEYLLKHLDEGQAVGNSECGT
ncbi:MAG TPA: TIGR03960 family B12-binding radical SAM protein [Sedimentisphaerales bacterium]|nr:TIGR03960 family B12-binding radical SAM protein [Sedimentisphaerales bacterium]